MQQKLVDIATELEAARNLVYKAAWEKDQGRDFARTAAMAKLFSGELSHRAANWALQIHGGYGFMDEYPISRLYRDQKILEIGEGTNEVQRMVIARALGYAAAPTRDQPARYVPHALPPVRRRRPRLRLVPRRRRGRGEAVVVDPAFAIEPYLEAAAEAGVRIVRVLETHTHADHLSGHGRFALEHGVPVSIHPLARPEYPFDPLADGQDDPRRLGRDLVRHTPGHRPEHCSFVVGGELVLTGDSMFVGEAARPDLAIEAREGAADLWQSLRRLAELPDATTVYPGHVSGSLCGTNMSDEHSTTIGREKQMNRGLREDEAHFVDEVGVADDAAAADDGALRRAQPRPVGRGAAAARAGSTSPARRS